MTESPPSIRADSQPWAMLCHLAALAGLIIPFGNILGPLLVYVLKKEDPLVADQGKEALNFQITVTIAWFAIMLVYVIAIIALIVSAGNAQPWFLLALPFFVALATFDLFCVAIASVRAYHGERFRYPLSHRFIR